MKQAVCEIFAMSMALMCVSCSQEGNPLEHDGLPEGEYPLRIGSVSIAGAENSQTRVDENTEGNGSVFASGDEISAQIGSGDIGTFKYNGSSFKAETVVCWQSENNATVTAWYPSGEDATIIDLSDQSDGLKYVLLATVKDAPYYSTVSCTFHNQLSKIRIKLEGGDQATDITNDNDAKIYLKTYTSCTSTKGQVTATNDATADYIQMHKATYGSDTYWEATVVPGYAIEYVKLCGIECNLSTPVTPVAGYMHEITVSFNLDNYKLLTEDITISDDNTYYFTGETSHSITINGGSKPTIYLRNFNASISGNGISITGNSTPTIKAVGANNTVTSKKSTLYYEGGAGICVESGSTVNITGRSGQNDVLKATGYNGGSGIGGYVYTVEDDMDFVCKDCGTINISNITLYAHGSSTSDYETYLASAGIGATGDAASCQGVNIEDAVVYAYGSCSAYYKWNSVEHCYVGPYYIGGPAIGNGHTPYKPDPTEDLTPITVTIKNSTVHAYRGFSTSDCIGLSYHTDRSWRATGSHLINCGDGGGVYKSTVYGYMVGQSTQRGRAEYDENGNITFINLK